MYIVNHIVVFLQFDRSLLLFKSDTFRLSKCDQTEYVGYQTPYYHIL